MESKTIFSTLANDPEMIDLVELFVSEIPEKIDTIEQLLAAEDWEQLQRISHQLKGAAGGYGFDCLTPLASRLESAARDRELSTIQTSAESLLSDLRSVHMI
ncbi:MAG: Hpt domain-containing protein [Pirellulaceae bacterium]